jgi:hypothetical protein
MRWSIIRLICLRDLRDQLRDRRTVVMIALLPLLLYPVLGMAVMRFAVGFAAKPRTIGIVGKGPDFPPRDDKRGGLQAVPTATWMALAPPGPGPGLDRLLGTVALIRASQGSAPGYPLLVTGGEITPQYLVLPAAAAGDKPLPVPGLIRVQFLDNDGQAALEEKRVDLLLSTPDDF